MTNKIKKKYCYCTSDILCYLYDACIRLYRGIGSGQDTDTETGGNDCNGKFL